MNRFFRSALFPLVIIAALVWLALQTLGGHSQPSSKLTLSQVQASIDACSPKDPGSCAFREIVFNPNKQALNYTLADGHVKWLRYEAAVKDNFWLWRRVKP